VTTILAKRVPSSVVSATTHTPASAPNRLVTTPPISSASIGGAAMAGAASGCWACASIGAPTASQRMESAVPAKSARLVVIYCSLGCENVCAAKNSPSARVFLRGLGRRANTAAASIMQPNAGMNLETVVKTIQIGNSIASSRNRKDANIVWRKHAQAGNEPAYMVHRWRGLPDRRDTGARLPWRK